MKESIKAVLLSALVYPGVGQLVLGSKISGALFAGLTSAGLAVIFYRLSVRTYHAIDPVLASLADNILTRNKLIEILNSPYDNWRLETISLAFVLACWVAAGVHAYHAGQRIDRMSGLHLDS